MSKPGSPLNQPLKQPVDSDEAAARRQRARDSLDTLRRQQEAGGGEEPPDVTPRPLAPREPLPPPPGAPQVELEKQREADALAAEELRERREHAKRQRAAKAALPPLRSGQNGFVLYDANGNVLHTYTPAQALELTPEEARKLTAVTITKGGIQKAEDDTVYISEAIKRWFTGGPPPAKTPPINLDDYIDPIEDAPEEIIDAPKEIIDEGEKIVDEGESIADKLVDAGSKVFDDLADMGEYVPYLVMGIAAVAVFSVVRPMLSGGSRSE